MTACMGDPEFYHSKFYPVSWDEGTWRVNEIINDRGISIRLDSRLVFEDYESSISGEFEALDFDNTRLFLDRNLYYPDTILKGVNLLDYDITEIETLQINKQSSPKDDAYIFWINRIQDSDFNRFNNGYYTIYIESITKSGYEINDSTVVLIE